MFYDQSQPERSQWEGFPEFKELAETEAACEDAGDVALNFPDERQIAGSEQPNANRGRLGSREYDRELIRSVWEFAEVVSGNDKELWRKDEFGDWINRCDFGKRDSEFGWEIFDPGVGRHAQGVYAMRPMQWRSFVRQFEALA
ncbi:MAG: hypothetical protein WD342_01835 [Verrucomicrobiales bacterium]